MTWLEISPELDDRSTAVLKRTPKAGIVNITVQGVFQSGGHFGHLNSYPNRFVARRVSYFAIVSNGMKSLEDERNAEKQWVCRGSNPK